MQNNMQSVQQQQQQQMAAMNMNAGMVPVNGTPVMGNLQRPGQRPEAMPTQKDPFQQLNTYIYDYFIRNGHKGLAKAMAESDLKLNLQRQGKTSPNGRNVNGVDGIDEDGLPKPELPTDQLADNSFLGDWWCQFWDIWSATRHRGATNEVKSHQYALHTRSLATLQNQERNKIMMMNGGGPNAAQNYQNLMRMNGVPNGNPQELKRQALNNTQGRTGPNPMGQMNMTKQAMISAAHMQRDNSGMGINGQRPQSPGSIDNAPSPNKRPRVDGPMNAAGMGGNAFNEFAQQGQGVQQKPLEVYTQSLTQHHGTALNNHAMAQAGAQGSPMAQPGLIPGHDEIFAGNPPRPGGMPAGAPGQPQQGGNHALQDYQMQLMLLEQQNKKRLLMARQEQDNMSTSHNSQGGVGGQAFATQAMSPQGGNRAGPSPNPADQMKRGTPKLNQAGLPGSPMPDAAMQQQRNSPAPNMNFDPNQMPPGMPPQFAVGGGYPQMGQPPMMRPPSSHPGFNGQQLNPQQLEAMRQGMQNGGGVWRAPGGPGGPGPQMPPGMMPGQGQQMGRPMNPNQQNQMPPPPAPAGEQPRAQEPSPSQPAAAPPTPNQSTKPNPKKKVTKNDKKPAKAKTANTGATPAASGEDPPPTPTPSTPITPMHPNSFGQNGKPQPGQPQAQAQPPAGPPQSSLDPDNAPFAIQDSDLDLGSLEFGSTEDFGNFDFDSFLHVDDPNSLGQFETPFYDNVDSIGEL